jgi:Cys-rich four helix bundle protein (predicted Tat secretion target)
MQRREFLAAVGTAAAVAAATTPSAFAEMSAESMSAMHGPMFKPLQEAAGHCVGAGNDCLRHCFGMLAMKDYSMTECMDHAYQMVAACGALQALAAVNSPHTANFARAVELVCADCQKVCEKFPDVTECKACGDACKAAVEQCRKIAA